MANKLTVRQIFGISGDSRNALSFSADHHIVYNAGAHVIVLNTENKDQGFISTYNSYSPTQKSLGCTALTCSYPKKFIAIAERGETVANIVFYDSHSLRKKRMLNYPELGSKEYKCIAFSDDGRLFLSQGAGPDWNLVLWSVDKSVKVVATLKVSLSDDNPVNQISFCPWDSTLAVAVGRGFVRIFRIIDGTIKSTPLSIRRENANIISHCWMADEILLLGTEGGEILLIENNEYRGVVYPSQSPGGGGGGMATTTSAANPQTLEELTPVYCLCATPRGFVAGTVDGEVRFFVRTTETRELFSLELKKSVTADAMGKVYNIALDSDDTIIVTTDLQQMYSINLSSLNQAKENEEGLDFVSVLTTFHGPNVRGEATITGMDIALWKPLLATVGKDKTMKLWNISDRKIDASHTFEEEPTSISLHPNGLYAAVAFPERVQMLSLLLDGFSHMHDLNIRAVNLVKFSGGGQFVACCAGTVIQVYHTYSGTLHCSLRGHTNKIRALEWLQHDKGIMSVGAEGASYFWDMLPTPGKHATKHDNILVPFTCGTTPSDGSVAYLATADRNIREVFYSRAVDPSTGLETDARPPRDNEIGVALSVLQYDDSRGIVIGSTCEEDRPGSVLTIQTVPQLSHLRDETLVCGSAVSTMMQSYDKTQLYLGDSNGILVVMEFDGVRNGGAGGGNRKMDGTSSFCFNNEVTIRSHTLFSKRKLISELMSKVDELTLNNEHQLRLKEMDYKDRQNDISNKFDLQLKTEKDKFDSVLEEKLANEGSRNNEYGGTMNKHETGLRGIESKYKAKLNAEATRYKTLLSEVEVTHNKWNEENAALVTSHQAYLKEMCYQYEEKLATEHNLQKKHLSEKEDVQVKAESSRSWIEEDGENEVIELKSKFEDRLRAEENSAIDLLAQHTLVMKQLENLTKDADTQRDEISRLRDRNMRLNETIRSLEKDIQSHKKEIREREETITDKEKRIFDLKKKNQELEKFRFVLDYKIRELKLQIEPREKETAALRRQSEEMTLELEQYHKSGLELELMLNSLRLKADGLRKELNFQEERENANSRLLEKFKRDLSEAWEVSNDASAFKGKIVKMYRCYVQEDVAGGGASQQDSNAPDASDPQEIYNRDREQLERNLEGLRRSLKTDSMAHKRDSSKMMREGVILTTELNTLRKDARYLELQRGAIARAGGVGPKTNLPELMAILNIELKKSDREKAKEREDAKKMLQSGSQSQTLDKPPSAPSSRQRKSRSAALRTTPAAGHMGSGTACAGASGPGGVKPRSASGSSKVRNTPGSYISGMAGDQWGAWKEIQMQNMTMNSLEESLMAECNLLGIDALHILVSIDANLASASTLEV